MPFIRQKWDGFFLHLKRTSGCVYSTNVFLLNLICRLIPVSWKDLMSFIFRIKTFFPVLLVFPSSIFMSVHNVLSSGYCFFDICSVCDRAYFDGTSGKYWRGEQKYF